MFGAELSSASPIFVRIEVCTAGRSRHQIEFSLGLLTFPELPLPYWSFTEAHML
jgi:hypothetical protein